MVNSFNYSSEKRPSILLFAEPNCLGISLVEKLLSEFCKITIITKDISLWNKRIEHLNNNKYLDIAENQKLVEDLVPDYLLIINNDYSKTLKECQSIIALFNKVDTKKLIIVSYCADNESESDYLLKVKHYVLKTDIGIISVGDILGPRIGVNENSILQQTIVEAIYYNKVDLKSKEIFFYPILVSEASREIAKLLFSFSSSDKGIAIISKKQTVFNIVKYLKFHFPQTVFVYSDNDFRRQEDKESKQIWLDTNVQKAINLTYQWIKNTKETTSYLKLPKIKKRPKKEKNNLRIRETLGKKIKTFRLIIFTISTFLIFCFLILFLSLGSLFLGLRYLQVGKLESASGTLMLSSRSSDISRYCFENFSKVPLVGNLFILPANISSISKRSSDMGKETVLVAKNLKTLMSKIMGKEIYDPEILSKEISLGLDYLYKEAGFLQSEILSWKGIKSAGIQRLIDFEKLNSLRTKILSVKEFSDELPDLLGKNKSKTYLLLFQNNMELRPTGGFIGSFALVTFEGGRLGEINVSDVYAADGQLKGHIEPPAAIKKYLGEAGWYLRDSNWDPDFPSSAQRAEWFLDKEIDRSVDGVVGIDLEVAKGILKVIGSIKLTDFNKTVDESNIYEVTQSEVESNFFAGSYKKTNFLTALAKELLNNINYGVDKNYFSLAKVIAEKLDGRHIQIFLHNTSAQKSISSLSFDGSVFLPSCVGNCHIDWLGIADANVGVNKANYFITKSLSLSTYLDGQTIKRVLAVNYENQANTSLGDKAKYISYLRLMVPVGVNIGGVEIVSVEGKTKLDYDIQELQGRKEIGVNFDVIPGQKKSVIFYWQNALDLDFSQEGEYGIFVRKQAGTVADPITINISAPWGNRRVMSEKFDLTKEGGFVYNNYLSRDFFSRIYW